MVMSNAVDGGAVRGRRPSFGCIMVGGIFLTVFVVEGGSRLQAELVGFNMFLT